MAYLMIGVSILMLVGYVISFKLIIDAKDKMRHSLGLIIGLNEVELGIREATSGFQGSHPISKAQLEKTHQSFKEAKNSISQLIDGKGVDSGQDLAPILKQVVALLDGRLVLGLDKWAAQITPEKAQEIFEADYLSNRSDLDDLITGAKAQVLLKGRQYGDLQTQYVRLAMLILGFFLLASTLISLFFFNRLSGTVLNILVKLSESLSISITSVQDSCRDIESVSQQVASSGTDNASAVEETAASMEEMAAMVAQSTTNANNSLNATRDSTRQVEKGKEIVLQMKSAMQQIQMANTKLSIILQIINDIKNKTKIINDIVFETRLLSFNASIEAARAGIHGKGFAVVAGEVGKLASISGEAADEIRSLLDSSVIEVNQIIGTTQEKVSSAKTVSEQCEGAFYSMAEAIKQIAEAMDGITTAAGQQEQGIQETNKAMMDISRVTHKNTGSAEKLLMQVTSLGALVESLMGLAFGLGEFLNGSAPNSKVYPSSGHVAGNNAESWAGRTAGTQKRDKLQANDSSPEILTIGKTDQLLSEIRPISRSDSRWKTQA